VVTNPSIPTLTVERSGRGQMWEKSHLANKLSRSCPIPQKIAATSGVLIYCAASRISFSILASSSRATASASALP
jgi:hypothetical protein